MKDNGARLGLQNKKSKKKRKQVRRKWDINEYTKLHAGIEFMCDTQVMVILDVLLLLHLCEMNDERVETPFLQHISAKTLFTDRIAQSYP